MATRSFAAQLGDFRDKTKERATDVLQQSVEDVLAVAQTPIANGGRMPVDTGHLINSLASELNGVQIGAASTAEDKNGPQSQANIELVTTAMQPGDTARFAWTAAHALPQHEGFVMEKADGTSVNVEGKHWVDGAAEQWSKIVERNVGRLK